MTGNSKPSVLYVITDSGVGGSENVLNSLLIHYDRAAYDVAGIIVLKGIRELGRSWIDKGFSVYGLGMKKIPTISVFRQCSRLIESTRPAIIHSFLFHSAQVCRLLKKKFPHVKLITSPRVNYRVIPSWAKWLDRNLARFDDLVVAESLATKEFLINQQHYSKSKVRLIRNGVDINRFSFDQQQRISWRRKWGFSDNEIVVGAVGRLHIQKGFDVLLQAISLLSSKVNSVRWVIMGEGPEEFSLKLLAKKLNVSVFFAGKISPMDKVYSAFDIYVQSSRFEGLSNSLLEAMSASLPIVATAVDGTLDVACENKNMILVQPGNIKSLADGLHKLIINPIQRDSLAKEAFQTAQQHSLQKMINEYNSMTCELLKI